MNGIILNQPIRAPYPLNAFLLVAREAAFEVLANVEAPDALVGMCFINGMSMACQGLIDVKLPLGYVRPVSQNMLLVAESGERKTAVNSIVLKPFMDVDKHEIGLIRARKKEYKTEFEPWVAIKMGLRQAISKEACKGESTADLEVQLAEHIRGEPKKPRLRHFLRQDITSRAIMDALQGEGESIAITTDEGHVLFQSAAMSQFGLLNRLWDSPEFLPLDRAGNDQIVVMNPRASVSIMTQSAPLKQYMERRGSVARGSGHWARYLVAWPQSTQGYRNVQRSEQVWIHVPKFHARIGELLEKYRIMIESGKVERELIEFSDDAKSRWFELATQAEGMLRPGEYLSDINDFASKIMEIISRLAATMHYFSGEGGKITLDTLQRAFTVVSWHIDEFKRLFSPQYAIPQDQIDARAVAMWLRNRAWRGFGSNSFVPKNYLLRNGPVRNRDRLNAALDNLASQSAIWIGQAPKNKQCFVNLYDNYFSTMMLA